MLKIEGDDSHVRGAKDILCLFLVALIAVGPVACSDPPEPVPDEALEVF